MTQTKADGGYHSSCCAQSTSPSLCGWPPMVTKVLIVLDLIQKEDDEYCADGGQATWL